MSDNKSQIHADLIAKIEYDPALPIVGERENLINLIKNHQVVVIAGETGSGKTTQIPKLCLEAGRGLLGRIGCTQPRRLAALSLAGRLAEELKTELGDLVGYQIRFQDRVQKNSLVKVMTDGILLAEIQRDRLLKQYDTIIIDEAHERSTNIDFLLGILKQILPKRPDLKLIITSATIDTARFAEHFANLNTSSSQPGLVVPIVEVSGRTYPVEIRYRPLEVVELDDGSNYEPEPVEGIIDALEELAAEDPFGDVLVFQVGERDIKETAEALRKQNLKNTEIVPLYARLSMAEQNKVFQTSSKRRIILSTNVAETSLTVPGIRYVIDPGLVRISRYSVRSKVQRLPIERISKASANQRAGRCGRVADGICIRLYSEEDFNSRPDFTDPEIHRTSLASVLLQMAQLKLGSVQNFPFIDRPEEKLINDGYRQLTEIGALQRKNNHYSLTETGRNLAKFPLEPRIGKMLLEAEKNDVLAEVLVIASAISIQDPRELNEQTRQAANKAHEQFTDPRSDFLFFLNLWRFYQHQQRHLSQSKLRKLCRTNFLSYLRMREWQDLFNQLQTSLKSSGVKVGKLHLYEEITEKGKTFERLSDLHSINLHRSLLSGLLGQALTRDDENFYLGARNMQAFIHPSSILYKRKPKWIMSAELVETTKLYARNNAEIDVRWLEDLAAHLIKKSYADPHWQKRRGQVGAYESATLYGLPIINRRACNYGPINPKDSNQIFIRALAQGEVVTQASFYKQNQEVIENIKRYESKVRRLDFLVDEQVLIDFYQARIPERIYSVPALESWFKKLKPAEQEKLRLTENQLLKQEVADVEYDFPDQIALTNSLDLELDYKFDPGQKQDGVVFNLPLAGLNLVEPARFEWLTPGFLAEKITFYLRSLPKNLRRQFVPAPATAEKILAKLEFEQGEFLDQLLWQLNRLNASNQKITQQDFGEIDLPPHLKPWFRLQDEKGKIIAESGDLLELKRKYQHLVTKQIQKTYEAKTKKPIEIWDFGDLPATEKLKTKHAEIIAYPGLVVTGNQVYLELIADLNQMQAQHGAAVWHLLAQNLADKAQYLRKSLNLQQACLCFAPYGSCAHLTEQIIEVSLQNLIENPAQIRTQEQFEQAQEVLKTNWISAAQNLAKLASEILQHHQKIASKIKGKVNPRALAANADLRRQLDDLIHLNFVSETPSSWLKQIPRYLQAIEKRLEKIDLDPQKDLQAQREMQGVLQKYHQLAEVAKSSKTLQPGLVEARWMLEELRISLFAQPMKTIKPVSVARIEKLLKQI